MGIRYQDQCRLQQHALNSNNSSSINNSTINHSKELILASHNLPDKILPGFYFLDVFLINFF